MHAEGFRYAVASLGMLVALFGSFLLLWGAHRGEGKGRPAPRACAWAMLLVGLATFAVALMLPAGHSPAVPAFLVR